MAARKEKIDYSNVHSEMKRMFGLDLTDDQIRHYSALHPITKRDSKDNVCDTIDRDILIDSIAQELLGEGAHWPMNMSTQEYTEKFSEDFHNACVAKGIKLVEEFWYKE